MVAGSRPTNGRHPGESPGAPPPGSTDPLDPILLRLAELREYAQYYLAARLDGYRFAAKKGVFYALLGLIGALAGAALIVVATVQVCQGAATGIGLLLGDRLWLGQLVVGTLILTTALGGAYFVVTRQLASARLKIEEKYELRKHSQRAAFGRDVSQRARNV